MRQSHNRTGSPGRRATGRRSPHAFTLIEVLIAIAILVIGMVGVLAAFASAIGLHQRGIDQTSAAMLAETVLRQKQTEALAGLSCKEMSTLSGSQYVFKRSDDHPAYESKVICQGPDDPGGPKELGSNECRLIIEVRMRPQGARAKPSSSTELQEGNVRFETILLRRRN